MRISKLLLRGAYALILLASLTGCWDNRPINKRVLVLSLGFDPAKSGQDYRTLFQAPTPTATAASQGGSGGSSSTSMDVFDVSGTGPDVAATFAGAQAQVSKDLFLGQTILVALSTKLSSAQLASIMSGLLRIGTLDKTPFVLATDGPTSQVLEHTSPQARFPCFYFLTLFSCAKCQTDTLSVRLWQLMDRQSTPGVDPFLPVSAPAPEGFFTNTVALYRKYQYVTTLSPQETTIFGILEGLSHKANFYFPRWKADVRAVTGSKSLSTQLVDDKVHATINLRLNGTLAQIGSVTESSQDVARLSSATAHQIATEATALIKKTQALDVDPWGIGRQLSWQHPNAFAARRPWHQTYPTIDVTVHCSVKIDQLGDVK